MEKVNDLAPIVLFVYNRPWHTEQTLQALQKNIYASESILYVYADGPKENSTPEQLQKINETRNVVKSKQWCKETHIVEREKNWGLADNIIDGVTSITKQYGKIIVLEDDIVTSPGFLKYMNDALTYYENTNEVMHVTGYMYPLKKQLPETFFYNSATCWGWGTWQRAWKHFNPDAKNLYDQLVSSNRLYEFDLNKSFRFLYQLTANKDGKLHTWAIKWHASVFLKKGLCLHPNVSLVNNIGFDGTGTNCPENSDALSPSVLAQKITVKPIELIENKNARKAIIEFNSPKQKISLEYRIKTLLRKLLGTRYYEFIKMKLKNQAYSHK
jgi:hypothetical protein